MLFVKDLLLSFLIIGVFAFFILAAAAITFSVKTNDVALTILLVSSFVIFALVILGIALLIVYYYLYKAVKPHLKTEFKPLDFKFNKIVIDETELERDLDLPHKLVILDQEFPEKLIVLN